MSSRRVISLLLLPVALLLTGCQKSGHMGENAIAPGPEGPVEAAATSRQVQAFYMVDVRQIFGPESSGHPSHGVDSAVLIDSAGLQPALISTVEGDVVGDLSYTAFVGLERHNDRFIPVYRWVSQDGQYAVATDSAWVPAQLQQCYNFPKCDAITFTYESRQVVELAVAYQWREDQGADWDIGVTRLRWVSEADGEITYADLSEAPDGRPEDLFDDDGYSPGFDELYPDLAYQPMNRDIYLVYSDYEEGQNPYSSVHLKYRRYSRASQTWSDEYWCAWHLSPYTETGMQEAHNAWHPRIDVGLVDDVFGAEDIMGVGIAYTAQNHRMTTFHVHVFYWASELEGNSNKYPGLGTTRMLCLAHPDYRDRYAGMPCIDISPGNVSDNYGSIVYAQVVEDDLYAKTLEIWEINSLRNNWQRVTTEVDNWADGLYPSIAIHCVGYGGVFPHRASVTYFRQQANQPDAWFPWIVQLGLDAYEDPVLFERWVDLPTDPEEPPYLEVPPIDGIFNTDQIPFVYPGAATAISATQGSYYWAGWCDAMHMEPAPNAVYAAWGRATP